MSEITKCVLMITTGIVCAVSMLADPAWMPFTLICFGAIAIVATRR